MHPPVVEFGLKVHHAQGVTLEPGQRTDAWSVERAPELAVEPFEVFGVRHSLRPTNDYAPMRAVTPKLRAVTMAGAVIR